MFGRLGGAIALAAVLTACGGSGGGTPAATPNTASEPTNRVTPILVKKELKSLGAFSSCDNASNQGRAFDVVICHTPGTEDLDFSGAVPQSMNVSAYRKFVEDEAGSLIVFIYPAGSTPVACLDAFSDMKPDDPVVTDGATFVAYGQRYRVDSLDRPIAYPGGFPRGVWPEDVARALGGKVTSVASLC